MHGSALGYITGAQTVECIPCVLCDAVYAVKLRSSAEVSHSVWSDPAGACSWACSCRHAYVRMHTRTGRPASCHALPRLQRTGQVSPHATKQTNGHKESSHADTLCYPTPQSSPHLTTRTWSHSPHLCGRIYVPCVSMTLCAAGSTSGWLILVRLSYSCCMFAWSRAVVTACDFVTC